jgi:DNA helicase-2/ATP-dependent DNA helicase PcrA
LYFKNKYPEAKVIYLESNYRSYQSILDSAGSLIEKNQTVLKHDLKAERGATPGKIHVVSMQTPEAERFAISEIIKEKIVERVPPGEIAVLYRLNRDAGPLADMLSRRGIAYTIESDRDILQDQDIRNIILLLEAIADFGNDEKLAEALHLDFLGLKPLEIYKALGTSRGRDDAGRKKSLYDVIATTDIGKKLATWKSKSMNLNFLNFFEELIKESGFLDQILSGKGGGEGNITSGGVVNFDKVSALTALFNEMKRVVGEHGEYRLTDFMRHLGVIREHHLPIKGPVRTGESAVRLMTAHKAKGLEFDVVLVAGATDGHWGNRRDPARFKLPFKTSVDAAVIEKNEDERRLFYMALTRARNELYITYAREREDGKAEVPSQFLGEIREDLRAEISTEEYEKKLEGERLALIAPTRAARPLEAEQEFLRELFKQRGLSATALNNYLQCPWQYFYINLLRIPMLENLNQIYGTATHAALENFFAAKKRGEQLSGAAGKEFMIDSFARSLKRHPLIEKDFSALLAKGKKTLSAYHDHYADSWNYNVATELKVKVPFGVNGDEIILRGALDKLELQEDPHEVIVVDYKTRSPKSRNWILGETADSEGNYHRQLVFYRLLLDASPELGYRMKAGQIDFVEPNDRGIFKKEEFVISEAEVGELRETVARVAQEIMDFAFWDKECGEKGCKWCGMRGKVN